jgi:hypothetical protein
VQPTPAAVVEKSQFRIEAGATHSPLPPSGAPRYRAPRGGSAARPGYVRDGARQRALCCW